MTSPALPHSKRPPGSGTITKLKDGRLWVRAPRGTDGRRASLGCAATLEDAETLLLKPAPAPSRTKPTFAAFGRVVLDRRELDGVRSIQSERSFFKVNIESAAWASKPLNRITAADGAAWLRELSARKALMSRGRRKKPEATDRLVARSTVKRALSVALAIFEEAGPNGQGLIRTNPFKELRVQRRPGEEATKEKWTFLAVEEQRAFLRPIAGVTEEERLFVLFSAGSGARQGEQFHLRLDDIHIDESRACAHPSCPMGSAPHAVLRFGSDGLPRKNNKISRIVLVHFALYAVRAWLPLREELGRSGPLLFPRPNGRPRSRSKPLGNGHFRPCEPCTGTHYFVGNAKNATRAPAGKGTHVFVDRWQEVLRLAGIARHVRWHDLRHTAGTALVQGHWSDEPWTLEETRQQLGHSSVAVTEKYAHLGPMTLLSAAKKIRAPE